MIFLLLRRYKVTANLVVVHNKVSRTAKDAESPQHEELYNCACFARAKWTRTSNYCLDP